jgi:hypothetical protein
MASSTGSQANPQSAVCDQIGILTRCKATEKLPAQSSCRCKRHCIAKESDAAPSSTPSIRFKAISRTLIRLRRRRPRRAQQHRQSPPALSHPSSSCASPSGASAIPKKQAYQVRQITAQLLLASSAPSRAEFGKTFRSFAPLRRSPILLRAAVRVYCGAAGSLYLEQLTA